jgi:membrane fusion protein (multidrug efflux system)
MLQTRCDLNQIAKQSDIHIQTTPDSSENIMTICVLKTNRLYPTNAKIDQQKLKLTYSKVYASENGKIGRKSVEPGQFIQQGQTLATIVQDSLYWVVANFKETQISRLAVGQAVNLKLDAFPDMELKGKIADFSDATGAKYALLPPDNASGNFVKVTQKIPVKIAIEGVEKLRDKLRAGMSLEVEVKIK